MARWTSVFLAAVVLAGGGRRAEGAPEATRAQRAQRAAQHLLILQARILRN